MDNVEMLIWVMGGGFSGLFAFMLFMFASLNKRMDQLERRMDRLEANIMDLRKDMHALAERLARIEGALMSKECCMLKNESQSKKAE